MPMIDLPLSQLKEYQGKNPRPADFDAYWDDALAEMHALGTGCELVPAPFQTPDVACYDLWFTGVGGARIHGKCLKRRDITGKNPAVCVYHGYSGKAWEFSALLGFAAQGFVVASLDCRGQGGLSEDVGGRIGNTLRGHITRGLLEDDPKRLLFRDVFLDVAQMASIVMAMPEVDENRVGCFGGSQGGALTLVAAALEPRMQRAASEYPFLCDYQRVWEMDLAKDAYEDLRQFFRLYDPLHEREEELFTKLGYIDVQYLAPRIRANVLMATGLMDAICPPSTQFAAYNKITAPKSMMLYPDFAHEGLPGWDDATVTHMLAL